MFLLPHTPTFLPCRILDFSDLDLRNLILSCPANKICVTSWPLRFLQKMEADSVFERVLSDSLTFVFSFHIASDVVVVFQRLSWSVGVNLTLMIRSSVVTAPDCPLCSWQPVFTQTVVWRHVGRHPDHFLLSRHVLQLRLQMETSCYLALCDFLSCTCSF